MPLFVVTYTHPDEAGWSEHLLPHIHYLQELLRAGTLRASGPLTGTPVKSALLVMAADDREALMAEIDRDPFAIHGLIAEMTVTEWDPIFGAFNADSTLPGRAPGG